MCHKVNWEALKLFGHVERMGEEHLTKRVHMSEVQGVNERNRLCAGWLYVIKQTCNTEVTGAEKCKGDLY